MGAVNERQWLGIAALDFGVTVGPAELRWKVAYATIDVPAGLVELHGDTQWGGHVDVIAPVWRPRLSGYTDGLLSAGIRFEHVDYNRGCFSSTGGVIRDDATALVPAVSFRPMDGTIFRINDRYQWTRDFVG
jgi:hypothetical protein